MSDDNSPKSLSDEDRAIVRTGYEAAVQLWTYEGEQNWARFNVMLLANSVLIGALAILLTSPSSSSPLSHIFAVAGIIVCIAWFLITKRGFDYQTYYVLSARELEEQYFNGLVKTASRGASFSQGCSVEFELDEPSLTHRMSWFSRLASAQSLSKLVIILFAVVYIFAIVLMQTQ
jgi:hypothetical protein